MPKQKAIQLAKAWLLQGSEAPRVNEVYGNTLTGHETHNLTNKLKEEGARNQSPKLCCLEEGWG